MNPPVLILGDRTHIGRVSLASVRAVAALTVVLAATGYASPDTEEPPVRRLAVYLQAQAAGPGPDIELRSPGLRLEIISKQRISPTRPLLLIVDPSSYPPAELRRRLSLLGKAISESPAFRDPGLEVRLGVPVLDGILTEPFRNPATLSQQLVLAVEKYSPDSLSRSVSSPGRTLDLIAAIIQKADTQSPVDCLVLATDWRIEEAEAAYLAAGMERRFLELCGRKGTTLYGLLDGRGALGDMCLATGGLNLPGSADPAAVLRQVLEARAGGYVLEARCLRDDMIVGRFDLLVRTGESAGHLAMRAPRAIWIHPDSAPAADCFHMREGLEWIRRAQEAYADGNATVALSFAENADREDPWNPQAAFLAGKSAVALGDLALAASCFSRATRLDYASDEAFVLYGSVMQKLGRAEEALRRFESLRNPGGNEKPAIRLQRARLLAASGRAQEARQIYGMILNTNLDDDLVRAEYGKLLVESGDLAEAQEQFRISLARNPRNSLALAGNSSVALMQGRTDEALQLALQALHADSRSPEAETQLGRVYAARQDWAPAVEHLKTAVALDPARLSLTLTLADTYLQAGRISEADDLVRTTLGSNPNSAALHQKLAEVCIRNGSLVDAAAVLEAGAARSGVGAAELYRQAAELRERRAENGQALLDYRAALESSDRAAASELASELRQHLTYLAMSLDGVRELARLPLGKQLGLKEKVMLTVPLETASESPSQQDRKLAVPGGIALLSRALVLEESDLKGPDALDRVVPVVLQSGSAQVNRAQKNSVQRSAIAALRTYADLLVYMNKNRLLPPGFDPGRESTLTFPLAGNKEETSRTAKLLAFFGVKYKYRESRDGKPAVEMTLKGETEKNRNRRQLLRHLGVNLQDRSLRQITVVLRQEHLPMPFPADTLTSRLLPGGKTAGSTLLERIMLSPNSMRLYLALTSCSGAAREALLSQTAPGELLAHADVLGAFGRYLDFRQGRLVLPGRLESWEALLETPQLQPGQFLSKFLSLDGGRPIALYAGLAVASPPVQAYFTASPERLRLLYQSLAPNTGARLATTGTGLGGQGLGRVLRQLSVTQDELSLNLGSDVVQRLLQNPGSQQSSPEGRDGSAGLIGAKDIPELAGPTKASVSVLLSPVEIAEFLHFLQTRHPGTWTEGGFALLMNSPAQAPLLVDLIGDLRLSTATIVRYLTYCKMLIETGNAGWNINRIRTSQSLFYLLSLLRRTGTLRGEEAAALLDRALSRMEAPNEPQFAIGITEFLSGELLPALTRNGISDAGAGDPVLRALAGTDPREEFSFEGKRLEYDARARRLERMQGAVRHQRFNPLSKLLETYRLLNRIMDSHGDAPDLASGLAQQLNALETAQISPGDPKLLRQSVAHVDLEALRSRHETALRQAPGGSRLRQVCQEIAVALHTELGVTLLTYCYAYHGSPEIDPLAFDANFVRKHSFFEGQWTGRAWTFAQTEKSMDLGTYIAGSISGIDSALGRLELAQSARDFAGDDRALLPTLLLDMRTVPGQARSDRAQEYIALSVRLGRALLTLAAIDGEFETWCDSYLSTIVPPGRRERLALALHRRHTSAATSVLSPSELLLLGQRYLLASGQDQGMAAGEGDRALSGPRLETQQPYVVDAWAVQASPVPAMVSPLLDRLRQLMHQAQATDGPAFHRELEQYGVLVRHRVGLRQFTLETPEPYEYLDLSLNRELLYERICDVKIRLAELHYSLGLPAYVAEADGEFALREMLLGPPGTKGSGWQRALEKIAQLRADNVRGWIDESLNRGLLTLAEPKAIAGGRSAP